MRKVKLLAGGMMLCIPLALIGVSVSKGDWVTLGLSLGIMASVVILTWIEAREAT